MRICLNRKVLQPGINFDIHNFKLQVKEMFKDMKEQGKNGKEGREGGKRKELKTLTGIYFIKIPKYQSKQYMLPKICLLWRKVKSSNFTSWLLLF